MPQQLEPAARTNVEQSTDSWINQIRQIVEEVDSLEALRDRLLQGVPGSDPWTSMRMPWLKPWPRRVWLAATMVVEEDPDALR